MKRLTIDKSLCRGLRLCHECEAIKPGLVGTCELDGCILISDTHYNLHQMDLSMILARCPDHAVMVMEV